jgi:hypothetical protein
MIFRASTELTAGREYPAGIVVLEHLPHVWCRCHPAHPALPTELAVAPTFPELMVGCGGNGEDGDASANGSG